MRRATLMASTLAWSVAAFAAEPVQIGTPISTATVRLTLVDSFGQRVNVKVVRAPLRQFFDEISRQTKLRFNLTIEVEQCTITAFVQEMSAREAMGAVLVAEHLTYQRLGQAMTISGNLHAPACPRSAPQHMPSGSCEVIGGKPISVECKDSPAADFAAIVFSQSDASFFFSRGAEDFPVSIRLKQDSLRKATKAFARDRTLDVKPLMKGGRAYVVSAKN